MPLRGLLSGIAMIVDERQQQLERWSAEHDDRHVRGELVEAAQQLLTAVQDDLERTPAGVADWGLVERHPDPIERLAIAGALLAAEIDRRLRCEHQRGERAAELLGTVTRDGGATPGRSYWIVEGLLSASEGISSPVVFGHGFCIPLVGDLDWTFAADREHATRFLSRETAERAIERMRQGCSRFSRVAADGTRTLRVTADYTFRAVEIRSAAPVSTPQPEPLAPDGEARETTAVPQDETHITAGLRIEEGPARGLDGAQLAWHYHITSWPSGTTLERGRVLSIKSLRRAMEQCWSGRGVELLLVRGAGIDQRIGGDVFCLAPNVLAVEFWSPNCGAWKWQRRMGEPSIELLARPASDCPPEQQLAELAHCVLTGEGEWDPDGAEDDDPPEDSVVELWEAINRYAQACGGDTSDASVSSARMDAVVAVGAAVTARIEAAGNLVGKRKLFRIQDSDRPMHVVAADWGDAIRAWRRELEECDQAADPLGVELVCDSSELRIEGEEVHRDAC